MNILINVAAAVIACSLDLAAASFAVSVAAMRMVVKGDGGSSGSETGPFIRGISRDFKIAAVLSLLWSIGAGVVMRLI